MIQRIQSIYLLLAGIFPAFTLFLPAIVLTPTGEGEIALDSLSALTAYTSEFAQTVPGGIGEWSLIGLCALSIILPLIAIFLYKNRGRQKRLSSFAIFCNAAWYIAPILAFFHTFDTNGLDSRLGIGLCFPLLAIVALLLAKRRIKYDEELLRAADRLR